MRATRNADALAGATFIAIALAFGSQSLRYHQGDFFQMGPGLFPLATSAILLVLGALVVARSLAVDGSVVGRFPVRALVLVTLAPVVFALAIEPLGFIVSAAFVVLMGAYASRRMTVRRALSATVILVLLSAVIFLWALQLPIPAIGSWLKPGI
jgi:hypothetical protein